MDGRPAGTAGTPGQTPHPSVPAAGQFVDPMQPRVVGGRFAPIVHHRAPTPHRDRGRPAEEAVQGHDDVPLVPQDVLPRTDEMRPRQHQRGPGEGPEVPCHEPSQVGGTEGGHDESTPPPRDNRGRLLHPPHVLLHGERVKVGGPTPEKKANAQAAEMEPHRFSPLVSRATYATRQGKTPPAV